MIHVSYALEILRRFAPRVSLVQSARVLVDRILDVPPHSLRRIQGDWYTSIEPWRRTVDDFDRLLLGLLDKRKIGLHFSNATWGMTVEQDTMLDALRIGSSGELHYTAINPEMANPTALKMFVNWADRARGFLIVIDREHPDVQRLEAAQEFPGAHMVIKGRSDAPVFFRSHWLLQAPLLLFNIIDYLQPEKPWLLRDDDKLWAFRDLKDFYEMEWLKDLDKVEDRNFILMLFAVANGLRLLEALEKLKGRQ